MAGNGWWGSMTPELHAQWTRKSALSRGEDRRKRIEMFAEALAEGKTHDAACLAAGVSVKCGWNYFTQIRKDLGPQAV